MRSGWIQNPQRRTDDGNSGEDESSDRYIYGSNLSIAVSTPVQTRGYECAYMGWTWSGYRDNGMLVVFPFFFRVLISVARICKAIGDFTSMLCTMTAFVDYMSSIWNTGDSSSCPQNRKIEKKQ